MNLLNDPIRVDIGSGERHVRVHHPERRLVRKRKDEQHRFIFRDVRPEHHSCVLLQLRQSQLSDELFRTDTQPERLQFRLRFGWNAWCESADRKSTRLNSSHEWISYAVFCLKKKTIHQFSCC